MLIRIIWKVIWQGTGVLSALRVENHVTRLPSKVKEARDGDTSKNPPTANLTQLCNNIREGVSVCFNEDPQLGGLPILNFDTPPERKQWERRTTPAWLIRQVVHPGPLELVTLIGQNLQLETNWQGSDQDYLLAQRHSPLQAAQPKHHKDSTAKSVKGIHAKLVTACPWRLPFTCSLGQPLGFRKIMHSLSQALNNLTAATWKNSSQHHYYLTPTGGGQ